VIELQEGILTPKDKISKHHHTAVVCLNIAPGTTGAQLIEGLEKLAKRIAILKQGKPEEEQEPWLVKGDDFEMTATWAYGNSFLKSRS